MTIVFKTYPQLLGELLHACGQKPAKVVGIDTFTREDDQYTTVVLDVPALKDTKHPRLYTEVQSGKSHDQAMNDCAISACMSVVMTFYQEDDSKGCIYWNEIEQRFTPELYQLLTQKLAQCDEPPPTFSDIESDSDSED